MRTIKIVAFFALAATALAACGNADPLAEGSQAPTTGSSQAATDPNDSSEAIVIGSQEYYSNEIVAEIYAQALEAKGLTVDRQFRIGQREAYMDEIESGKIDLFPEYSGPLLRYWDKESTATTPEDVYTALQEKSPEGVKVYGQSSAADQDSYVVTQSFAQQWGLTNLSDLTKVTEPITVGANSEAETRPYGSAGLKEKFNLEVKFSPIEDGGGPLTVKALRDNEVQMAIIYSASPELGKTPAESTEKLVPLKDDKGLFTASNIVAIGSADLPEQAVTTVNEINEKLDTDQLIALNIESVDNQKPAAEIAKTWLETSGN